MFLKNLNVFGMTFLQMPRKQRTYNLPPYGGGTPRKEGDLVKGPAEVLNFPLQGGDTEQSKDGNPWDG